MRTDDFDYSLPPKLIATEPPGQRTASRLMAVQRGGEGIEHRRFSDLPRLLVPGDCLVLNDTRVIPARMVGRRSSGGRCEVLLLYPEDADPPGCNDAPAGRRWRALVKPGKKLPAGQSILLGGAGGSDSATLHIEEVLPGGERIVSIDSSLEIGPFLDRFGRVPLPPYIVAARRRLGRDRAGPDDEKRDRERYQTLYAKEEGSVAAPTAGLHFTPELLKSIESRGIEIRFLTLHIGPGTFAPVKSADPKRHKMHRERFRILAREARAIDEAVRDPERRVIAVGTTVTRVLESCMLNYGKIEESEAWTDLLILPGHEFRAVDGLITNFHLPRSTLMMLVCALAGRQRMLRAYQEAIDRSYRFYSYGDAMFIAAYSRPTPRASRHRGRP